MAKEPDAVRFVAASKAFLDEGAIEGAHDGVREDDEERERPERRRDEHLAQGQSRATQPEHGDKLVEADLTATILVACVDERQKLLLVHRQVQPLVSVLKFLFGQEAVAVLVDGLERCFQRAYCFEYPSLRLLRHILDVLHLTVRILRRRQPSPGDLDSGAWILRDRKAGDDRLDVCDNPVVTKGGAEVPIEVLLQPFVTEPVEQLGRILFPALQPLQMLQPLTLVSCPEHRDEHIHQYPGANGVHDDEDRFPGGALRVHHQVLHYRPVDTTPNLEDGEDGLREVIEAGLVRRVGIPRVRLDLVS